MGDETYGTATMLSHVPLMMIIIICIIIIFLYLNRKVFVCRVAAVKNVCSVWMTCDTRVLSSTSQASLLALQTEILQYVTKVNYVVSETNPPNENITKIYYKR